jgi:hypothetical protein
MKKLIPLIFTAVLAWGCYKLFAYSYNNSINEEISNLESLIEVQNDSISIYKQNLRALNRDWEKIIRVKGYKVGEDVREVTEGSFRMENRINTLSALMNANITRLNEIRSQKL